MRRQPWRRTAPAEVEVAACAETTRGNGLFARVAAQPGDLIVAEDPVCGTAMLLFGESRPGEHCAHCTVRLPRGGTAALPCPTGCDAVYCSEACREDAMWSHHALLCPAVNQAWADFETHARECSNEYYVLAARAFASLRHVDLADGSVPEAEAQPWESMPWAGYAARPWWETMRRPAYTDSGGSSSGSSNRGSRSRSCSSGAGDREVGDGQAGVAAGSCAADSDGRCRAQVAGGLASQDGPAASGAGEALHSEARAGAGGDSGASVASDSSLDRYFVSKVREQTRATVELLRHALAAEPSSFAAAGCGSTAAALLDEGEEALGRLVGLLRVNVLSVQATSAEEGPQKEDVARGMAIYALTCAMNHSSEPNCFAESDPEVPQRCHVRAARAVEVGDELCIDYLAGSPYDAEERRGILRRQYSIVQAQGVA